MAKSQKRKANYLEPYSCFYTYPYFWTVIGAIGSGLEGRFGGREDVVAFAVFLVGVKDIKIETAVPFKFVFDGFGKIKSNLVSNIETGSPKHTMVENAGNGFDMHTPFVADFGRSTKTISKGPGMQTGADGHFKMIV